MGGLSQALLLRLATGKKRKTTLVQYETLQALRSTMVAKIAARVKASKDLVKEISTKVQELKNEAKTDVEDWQKKAKDVLGEAKIRILAKTQKKGKDGDKKTKKKKPKKTIDKEKKKKKSESSESEVGNSDGGSEDDDDQDDQLEEAAKKESSDSDGHESSDSEATLPLDPDPKRARKEEKKNRNSDRSLSSFLGSAAPNDQDLWKGGGFRFTPEDERKARSEQVSDALVEMLSTSLHGHFKVQAVPWLCFRFDVLGSACVVFASVSVCVCVSKNRAYI